MPQGAGRPLSHYMLIRQQSKKAHLSDARKNERVPLGAVVPVDCGLVVRMLRDRESDPDISSGKQRIEIEGCQIKGAAWFQTNQGQREPLHSRRSRPDQLDLPFNGSHYKLLQGESTSRGERLCPTKESVGNFDGRPHAPSFAQKHKYAFMRDQSAAAS